jgi:hypothetical protein
MWNLAVIIAVLGILWGVSSKTENLSKALLHVRPWKGAKQAVYSSAE